MNQSPKYVTFNGRMLASIIDTLLSSLLLIPILRHIPKYLGMEGLDQANVAHIIQNQPTYQELALLILSQSRFFIFDMIMMSIAVIVFWSYRSATPGKIILKMKICDAKTLEKPSIGQYIIRYLSYFISLIPLGLGFIWIHYDKKHQGWHDKLAGTVVVYE